MANENELERTEGGAERVRGLLPPPIATESDARRTCAPVSLLPLLLLLLLPLP